jgi:hypothetical protein
LSVFDQRPLDCRVDSAVGEGGQFAREQVLALAVIRYERRTLRNVPEQPVNKAASIARRIYRSWKPHQRRLLFDVVAE